MDRQTILYTKLNDIIDELLVFLRKEIFGQEKISSIADIRDYYWTDHPDRPLNILFGYSIEPEQDKLPSIHLLIFSIMNPALDISDGFQRVVMDSDIDKNFVNVFDVHQIPITMNGVFIIRTKTWLEQFHLALYLYTALIANIPRIHELCPSINTLMLGAIQLASSSQDGIYNAQIGFNTSCIITTYIEDKINDVTKSTFIKTEN
ncbi:MAG: hypothetical protein QXQ43_03685 [Nitrososphaerota archaeon]